MKKLLTPQKSLGMLFGYIAQVMPRKLKEVNLNLKRRRCA